MAAMAYGLLLCPDKLWNPLSDEQKNDFAQFLYTINDHEIPECNWQMFRVLVNIALKKRGLPYDARRLEDSLKMTESFYLGDGWYRDGDSNQRDYYISFAMHFYSLVYVAFMEKEDAARCARFKERAMLFARQFIYWFDEGGAALPFGRSLTYRFSQVSFFSACLLAGIEPFSVAQMKGLIVRHLRYWLSLPIFDREDILTIGYGYPNLMMSEKYNGPGSPYWAMKTFAFLALPDDHPFWRVEAAPMPKLDLLCPMPFGEMLVCCHPNHHTAYTPGVFSPAGHGHSVEKYGKFAYDTRFGFSIARSCYELHENCPDSMLAFVIDGDVYVRRIAKGSQLLEDRVVSVWSPYPGIDVETVIIPTRDGHVREHKITSTVICQAYDCGFAVSVDMDDNPHMCEEDHAGLVENKFSLCRVSSQKGKGFIIPADPNTNLIYPKTRIPAVRYDIGEGTETFVTQVKGVLKSV